MALHSPVEVACIAAASTRAFEVKNDKLSWYWHSKGIGGYGALDYLMKIESLSFRQAVESVAPTLPTSQEPLPDKFLVLPEKARILQSRLTDYLCQQRGIDPQILSTLLENGSIYEDRHGNVVFVGFDELGKPRFATYGDQKFRMDCAGSNKRDGFHMTYSQTERLYIFESPIDAMSHASLENIYTNDNNAWHQDNRLSLAGTADTALPKYLEAHHEQRSLCFALTVTKRGRDAAVAICRKYTDKEQLLSHSKGIPQTTLIKCHSTTAPLFTNATATPPRSEVAAQYGEAFKAEISLLRL